MFNHKLQKTRKKHTVYLVLVDELLLRPLGSEACISIYLEKTPSAAYIYTDGHSHNANDVCLNKSYFH